MGIKLMPCPFCGGWGHILKMQNAYWIYCMECGAKVQGEEEGLEAAAIAWNRRQGMTLEQMIVTLDIIDDLIDVRDSKNNESIGFYYRRSEGLKQYFSRGVEKWCAGVDLPNRPKCAYVVWLKDEQDEEGGETDA